jgi:hypothetical protein
LNTIFKYHSPSKGPFLTLGRLACVLATLAGAVGPARADGPGVPGATVFYSGVQSLEDTIASHSQDPRPQSTQGALPIADWLLYGGLGWGAACGVNLNQSPTNQQQACGPQFTPSVVAEHNTGIQRTLLYGVGDIRWYPTLNQVQVVDTKAGVVHVWEIERDLIFRVQAQGMENQNYSGFAANLLPTNAFVTSPVKYTQGYASTSIQKEFGSFFAAIGGSTTGTAYQNIQDSFGNTIDETFQNGTVSTLNGRFGYHLSAVLYTYIESAGNWQRYNESLLNSEGYRVVAGVGTGRISLFNGELYAGYATQRFEDPLAGTTTVPVFGGRVSWFPTRFLTFTFNADRAFGTSDFNPHGLGLVPVPITPVPGQLPGSVTTTTTARLSGNWNFSDKLAFTASVGDQEQDYLASSRRDNLVALTAGVTYQIWKGLGVSATYTHGQLFSNFPGASFTTDFISFGGSSHF